MKNIKQKMKKQVIFIGRSVISGIACTNMHAYCTTLSV